MMSIKYLKDATSFAIGICIAALPFLSSNVFAINGPNTVADCGQQRVQPDDDFSLLKYQPGDLPANNECTHPNIGTAIEIIDNDPDHLAQVCSGSLIHVDDHKAVFLYAAHCTDGYPAPIAITFEPQPSTPYSAPRVQRDASLTQNLIPVSTRLVHPLFRVSNNVITNILTGHDIALLVIDNTDDKVTDTGLTPLRIPPEASYLDNISPSKLQAKNWRIVGYQRLERTLGNDPDATVSENFKELRPAQHNRNYADTEFVGIKKNSVGYLGFNTIITNQQTNAGRDGVCNGDSGGPIIIDGNMVVGVSSLLTGIGGNPTPGFCDLRHHHARTDLPENWTFIKCVTDPDKTVADVQDCENIFD